MLWKRAILSNITKQVAGYDFTSGPFGLDICKSLNKANFVSKTMRDIDMHEMRENYIL